jgi:hypothetical protein
MTCGGVKPSATSTTPRDRWHLGYGENVPDDEVATFIDIVRKHAGAANVVHPKLMARNEVYITRSRGDSDALCEHLRSSL